MMGNVLSDVKQTVIEKNDADGLLKVKQYLRKWGRVQQICGEHQVRIVQYNRLLERLQQHKCKMGAEEKERIEKSYKNSIQNMVRNIEELNWFANRMERIVGQLDPEEEMLIRMYYGREASINTICMRLCIGRSTMFRIRDKALKNLLKIMEGEKMEGETEDED